jgi:hypothetical protein
MQDRPHSRLILNEEKERELEAKEQQLKEREARGIEREQTVRDEPITVYDNSVNVTNDSYYHHSVEIKETNIIKYDLESKNQSIKDDKDEKSRHKFGNQMTDSEWEREKARHKKYNH